MDIICFFFLSFLSPIFPPICFSLQFGLKYYVLFCSFVVAVDEIHNAPTAQKFEISFPRKGD